MNNIDLSLEKSYTVQYSQMNCDLALKPYALFNFLQDIASENAENLGFGYSFMSSNNLAWFLLKYRMEFNDYPVNVYNLKLKTCPRGYNRLFAYRSFELLDDKKTLGKVFSVWSVINLSTRNVQLVETSINNSNMPVYKKDETDLVFSKIRTITNIHNQKEFFVRYNDLDVNGHANNGNYVIWAFETLDMQFLKSRRLKTLDVVFKKEALYGQTIISEVEFCDDKITLHRIKNSNNEDLCLFECKWI